MRNFLEIVSNMIKCIPEETPLKYKLAKEFEKYPYKAPEIRKTSWISVQDAINEYIMSQQTTNEEIILPEWADQMLNIWTAP